MQMNGKSRLSLIFSILILFAFLAKIVAGFALRETFIDRGNSHTYLNLLAYNIYLNHEFSIVTGIPSVDYEPLYPLLMSAAYFLSGNDWLALTIIQALLHALTSIMIYFLAKRLCNETAGFFAGCAHLIYPYFFTYSLSIYDTTLFVFCIAGALFFTFKDTWKISDFIFAGLFCGLGFLTRATMITFLPGIFLFIFIKSIRTFSFFTAFINCSLIAVSGLAVMFPWLLRNYHHTGHVFVSAHGPFGLWQGNNDYTYDYLKKNISLDEIYRMENPPDIYLKYPMKQRLPQNAIAVASEYQKEATGWIKNHPKEFIALAFLKAQKLWTWNRNPSSSNPVYGSNEGRRWVNIVSYLPLLLATPFGLFFLYKKNKLHASSFALILASYTGAHMIAMGFTRARLPLDIVLMILFGIAFSMLIQKTFPQRNDNSVNYTLN